MNSRYRINRLTPALLLILTLACIAPLVGALDWSSDIRLTIDSDWDLIPSVTQAMDGSIWVVWSSDRIGNQDDLYFKTSADYGLSWSSDIRLTTNSADDNIPSIIQALNGAIWVVWSSDRAGNYDLYFKTSADYGLSWSSDIRLTTNSSRDTWPSICQDSGGTIWVVWSSDRTGDYEIFCKTSADYGLSWSPETKLTTDPSWDLSPSITETWDGTIWVAWSSYRTGDYEIFCKTSADYGLSWSSDIRLTTDSDFDEGPSIIQAVDGSIWVVWQSDRAGKQYDLYFKTSLDYGLTWSLDTRLTSHNADDMRPSIASTDQRRIWVVWETPRTGEPEKNFEIFYKFSDVIPVHDVAITDVTPSETNVTGGETINISVVAENQGTESETFDVNCYANSTLIGSETVTLTYETSETLTFPWITPLTDSTYTVSANATTVPGETLPNRVDNTFTDGTVQVVKPFLMSDVDGDGDVDLDDLFYVLIAYGMTIEDAMATYGVPPGTDIDEDGWIDLDDLYYVLRDFGES